MSLSGRQRGIVATTLWGLVATLLVGCMPGKHLAVPYTSAEFASESRVILERSEEGAPYMTALYDLAEDRAVWTSQSAPPDTLSPNGEYGVSLVAEGAPEIKDARLRLTDLKHGTERTLSVVLRDADLLRLVERRDLASRRLAVNDDGTRVAVFAGGELRVFASANGAAEAAIPVEAADGVSVAFLPGERGLAVNFDRHALTPEGNKIPDDYTPYVLLGRRSGGGWVAEKSFVAWSWAAAPDCLLLVAPEGIVRYDARGARVIVSGELDSYVDVSPDGRNIAFEYGGTLRVYQLDPPRQLFSAPAGDQFRLGTRRLVVFEDDGDLYAYDLPGGKAHRLRTYGARNRWVKNLYQEGATQETIYSLFLGPAGHYASYYSGGDNTIIDVDGL